MAAKVSKGGGGIPLRQLDERPVPCHVRMLAWSPTMDLVAVASSEEVMLFRLSWQRVWHRPGGPTALAWRPDGRVLAIGLAEGKICLVEVEAAETIHKMEVEGEVTSLIWTSKCESVGGDLPTTDFYKDMSGHFLPKLPALDKTYTFVQRDDDEDMEGIEDMKRLRSQTRLNMLVAGTDTGWVHFFAFGIFPSGSLDLVKSPGESCRIISAVLSEDLGLLTVVSEHSASSSGPFQYHLSSFDVPLLQHKHRELMVLAKKYGQITSLLSYLASTIKAISEAWEDILLEIDCKLTNYAQEKAKSPSTGTVSDDFLELLMFGTLTDPLERFLLNDLTEKGLKKIGHSIDLSYSNIQKLVLKHLQSVTQCLFYHMGDIRGMAGWEARFGELGLSPTATHDAIVAIASFLMKSIEVQQVIDDSMKNFKAFFRWLYTVIMRLADEQVPVEIIKVNQQDLDFVADFLKDSFSAEWSDENSSSTFNLERVGQYLKDEDLKLPPEVSDNPWVQFLGECPEVGENKLLFPHYPNKSLIQQQKEVNHAVAEAFLNSNKALRNKAFHKRQEQLLFVSPAAVAVKASHVSAQQLGYMYTVLTKEEPPCDQLYLVRESLLASLGHSLQAVAVTFGEIQDGTVELRDSPSSPTVGERCLHHGVQDLQFYNEETLSVLLQESGDQGTSVLLQLPLKEVCQNLRSVRPERFLTDPQALSQVDGGPLAAGSRRLDTMRAACFSVSGTRKVACVVFSSLTRVRLFEMDAEDEEDDEDDPTAEDDPDATLLDPLMDKENSFS